MISRWSVVDQIVIPGGQSREQKPHQAHSDD